MLRSRHPAQESIIYKKRPELDVGVSIVAGKEGKKII
jgi:hypothetical protein